ncbi:hypothetical protein Y694_04629 [Methylibium sp. T29-B]|nr:hypothetical protein Y694_04629 [Methylibium sp. T29-B]
MLHLGRILRRKAALGHPHRAVGLADCIRSLHTVGLGVLVGTDPDHAIEEVLCGLLQDIAVPRAELLDLLEGVRVGEHVLDRAVDIVGAVV